MLSNKTIRTQQNCHDLCLLYTVFWSLLLLLFYLFPVSLCSVYSSVSTNTFPQPVFFPPSRSSSHTCFSFTLISAVTNDLISPLILITSLQSLSGYLLCFSCCFYLLPCQHFTSTLNQFYSLSPRVRRHPWVLYHKTWQEPFKIRVFIYLFQLFTCIPSNEK